MLNLSLTGFARFKALLVAFLGSGLLSIAAAPSVDSKSNSPIVFNRDIRPVLTDNCFACHGFDANKRKADLRLDNAEGATAVHKGHQAIKPHNLAESELWRRITATDPKVHMPPAESGKKLKPEQIALLRKWIETGAVYQKHWAFEPPVRPEPPPVTNTAWPRNDIDRFILGTLQEKQLQPSAPASKETLIRRVTLDLTGLPPSLTEVDAFVADQRPDAYEQLVERLLQSPRYGEHMARYWLDVARYGDTHGLHLDNERSLWSYRDWVVDSFNQNMPFDQFTIWQLAGDLLPKPSREQLIASGFNRCNVSTSEGGAIDEEFQVRYAIDRVETTSTTWMGLTMGCAVCHDHKLDPISQKEFYQVFSIFNNISENAMDGNALLPPPMLKLPTSEQEKQVSELDGAIAAAKKKISDAVAAVQYLDPATVTNTLRPEPKEIVWVEDDFPSKAHVRVNEGNEPNRWVTRSEGQVFSGERAIQRVGKGLHQVSFDGVEQPLIVGADAKFYAYVYLDPKDPPKAIMLQVHTDEWRNRANWGDEDAIGYGAKGTTEKVQMGSLPETGKWIRLEVEATKLGLPIGTRISGMAFTQFDGTGYWDKAGLISVDDPAQNPNLSFIAWEKAERDLGDKSNAPQHIKELLKKEPGKLEEGDHKKLREYFLGYVYDDAQLAPLRTEWKSAKEKRDTLEKDIPATMISKELEKPRKTWVLIRGQYDKHGEEVGPGVPSILPPLQETEVTNRLAFARWLVDPKHPLTSRVIVNRFWQQFFGTGIVKTAEDFGNKGEWPSHPELLDWLATEFMRSGWDVKHMLRLIVTSATYRQDSRVTPKLFEVDPENRLLARGPRFRLDAEELRDYALEVAGLLNLKAGGRGMRPYQPSGIWEAVGYTTSNTAKYSQDHGDAIYRRSLYIFWKRTAPPPSMTTFDAPSREKCCARRERTDTPLQALLTMNAPEYFEAARHLGYRMLRECGTSDADRLRNGFRLVTARTPSEKEASILVDTLAAERARYANDEEGAKKALSVGESPLPDDVPAPELAAYTMVANLLLNLDEAITKN
ncbi:MAG TPA: PSD1 and planctomycete cytochrome C domain-containing protein [Candidatus Limnocylindrales bacterium]|nr:PSD1 and planctomycete cytochrome C domain-containing protein [Candidatus Limnocylindrales bacterium]